MASPKFDKAMVKKIAREYVFTDTTYSKLAEKYGCSSTKISTMMNHEILRYSRILYALAEWKAEHNRKKNMKKFFGKKN